MAKAKTIYVCEECGSKARKWQGQCFDCGAWSSFKEQTETKKEAKTSRSLSLASPQKLNSINSSLEERISSGISEFDRILGGGIVKDAVVIVSAEPGVGKSTILLQISANVVKNNKKVLYVSGEENEGQIRARAERILGKIPEDLWVLCETNMDNILNAIEKINPDMIVVDSIQTVCLNEHLPSRPGGSVQIMTCSDKLIEIAKNSEKAVFMVGQVTKSKELAGVKSLEHAVDCFVHIEGDRKECLRTGYALKNRYGSTDELALFVMSSNGLIPIANPSEFFTTQREKPVAGCTKTICMEGTRPLIVEVEALVTASRFLNPMRIAKGIDRQDLQVLTAILEKKAGLSLGEQDVYVKVAGGLKITEPAVNLGVIMAVVSGFKNEPLDDSHVFVGEVGLTGEIKPVPQIEKRLKEIEKMGFRKATIPKGNLESTAKFKNLSIEEIVDIGNIA